MLRRSLFTLTAVASLITANHATIADDHQALSPGEQIVSESIFPPGTVPLDPSKASAYSPVNFPGAAEERRGLGCSPHQRDDPGRSGESADDQPARERSG